MASIAAETCAGCGKTADASTRMLVCSRCQATGKRRVSYCSRACQVSAFPSHKPWCGVPLPTASQFPAVLDPSASFQPPPALLFHLAALSTLPPPAMPTTPPPSFLYFSSTPVPKEGSSAREPPMPVPISLPTPARNLFNSLQLQAFRTGNALAVNLMFSLLLTEVEALGGVEDRLVEQLAEEYRLDGQVWDGKVRPHLKKMLEDEEEPTGEELTAAIGGEENAGMLLEWQMYEADRITSATAQ